MRRRQPSSTRTYTLFPYATLFRSVRAAENSRADSGSRAASARDCRGKNHNRYLPSTSHRDRDRHAAVRLDRRYRQIGRAHVCTPVTNAHLVCRLLLEKNNLTLYSLLTVTLDTTFNTNKPHYH